MSGSGPSDLVLLVVKISFLALLWLFVLAAVRAVRADMFGPTKRQRQSVQGLGRPTPAQPAPAHPAPPPAGPQNASPNRRARTPSKLVVTKGHLAGTILPLGPTPVTIGRAQDSTLVLEDDFASARHARLVPHDGQWFVEDLGSTNGTYLDRTKVTSPMPVPLGAPVRIGKTVLELHR
ncbi:MULTISPECIES: FHA domain-containing protein [Protofrankia]|uniref:Signal peptide protein n=1 Tax=Protofrankia coriariae TaxID=1562887 RepID=A0ABR5F219_9ACTN|nr:MULTISPECIES: FHA domain-containing protein [Protofrankia]KLL10772.1 signal peptide protein [Protofrankia coriariae]ONH33017.1 FHA domain-containing protein [Protofrankia sp. BMG5.30]